MISFKNQFKTLFLLTGLTALMVALGAAFGERYALWAFAMAVVLNIGAYFFSDRIVLAMHQAREVSPEESPMLHRIVAELALSAEIPKPRICVMPSDAPNAFATGRDPAHSVVAVTEGILRVLTERELRGVLAHELSHIKNRDILVASVAAVVAASITYLASSMRWFAIFGGRDREDDRGGAAGLALILVAPFVAMLMQFAISRTREYGADETGAKICKDPEALASALEKLEKGVALHREQAIPATASLFIVSPFAGLRSFTTLFSTHPQTQERIKRLRSMVSW